MFRAPLDKEGLAPFCKDSFFGKARFSMWKRQAGRRGDVIVEAESTLATVEVLSIPSAQFLCIRFALSAPSAQNVKYQCSQWLPYDLQETSWSQCGCN